MMLRHALHAQRRLVIKFASRGSVPTRHWNCARPCTKRPIPHRLRHGGRVFVAANAARSTIAEVRVPIAATFEIEYLQYLDAEGKLVRQDLPEFAKDTKQLVELYKTMSFVRVFDSKAVALQRTGKLGTYASCLGHEAAHVAIGSAMQIDDVFAPMYREYGAQFVRGVKPREVLMYWGGDERGNDFSGPAHDFAWCVPIATQCLHACGAALAFKTRKEPRVAVSVVGDGGSSKTDFYAAINMAGAQNLPYISVIVNNQWAISVPRSSQTGAKTLAQKGIAAGLECLQVDGNDIIAMRAAMDYALKRARHGHGGMVIEAVTYRLSDHTTADDARRYRPEGEVKDAWLREPMKRFRNYLTSIKAWDEAKENAWKAECEKLVDVEVNAYLETKPQAIDAMFDFVYAELPTDLQEQKAQALAWEKRHD
jgi:2-oxoisovalerate dehydrogenase E1 component alpha subunit